MCHAQWQYQYFTYILLIRMVSFFWWGKGGRNLSGFNGTIDYKSFDKREEYKWYKCREMKHKRMITMKNTKKKIKSTQRKFDLPIRSWMFTFIPGAAKGKRITSNKEKKRNHIFFICPINSFFIKDILRRHYKEVTNNSIFYKQQHIKYFSNVKKTRITIDLNN